jgi:formylglycine-generating enzyme required for sulfatase activity
MGQGSISASLFVVLVACQDSPCREGFELDAAGNCSLEEVQDSADPVELCGPKVEMIAIPGGTLGMACAAEDDNRCDKDYHEVEVAPFSIDRFEVEIYHFDECVAAGQCDAAYFESAPTTVVLEAPGMPAGGIQWHQAGDYCEWVGKRLPTSAEWELAARGLEGGHDYPWGSDWDPQKCNGCDREPDVETGEGGYEPCDGSVDGYAGAAPIDAHPSGASPYGVEQMCGNILEWVSDPIILESGELVYAIRGGGWGPSNGMGHPLQGLISWAQLKDPANAGAEHIGVRCAKDGG